MSLPPPKPPAIPAASPIRMPGALTVAFAALLLFAAILGVLHGREFLGQTLMALRDKGALAISVFVLVYVAASLCLLPVSILTLGAGAVYGLTQGTIIVSFAATAGASANFLVSRFLARDWVRRHLDKRPLFRAVDE